MGGQRIIALLGRRDEPTDAVEEYCHYLGNALKAEDFDLIIERVPLADHGWNSAMRFVRSHAKGWRGTWALVQYTALAWSRRGFPLRFPRILKSLKAAGVRTAVVYHDVEPYGGTRVIDRLRRRTQLQAMRQALRLSDVAVFTVPMEKLSWLNCPHNKALFIPVGANFPTLGEASSRRGVSMGGKLTIAVFGITGGVAGQKEVQIIVDAVRFADRRLKNLRLMVLGRNSQTFESELRKALRDTTVELHVQGVLSREDVVRSLCVSDVLLFVRGPISTRRGSAIAGIACGLPVIAFEGPETAPPITEAGLALYSPERRGELGDILLRVLEDEHYRALLAQRSLLAQQQYFSWSVIATQYAKFMRKPQ